MSKYKKVGILPIRIVKSNVSSIGSHFYQLCLRWRSKEPHDVVIDCEKVSLDPNDCPLQESEMLSSVCPSRQSFSDGNPSESSGVWTSSENSSQQAAHDEDRLDSATQTGTSLQNPSYHKRMSSFDSGMGMLNSTPLIASNAMFCSPTTFCSLTTPPPSQDVSPTGSTLDVSLNNYSSPFLTFNSSNISNIELGDLKTTPMIPKNGSRILKSNATQQTSQSCATEIVGDSTVCETSTSPDINVDVIKEDTEKHNKEACSSICGEKKQNCVLGVDENIVDESSSDDQETTEKTPGVIEKDPKYKARFPGELLEMFFSSACCRHCMDEGPRSSNKAKLDWESQLSPAQLLDQYLKFGKSLQENRLNR